MDCWLDILLPDALDERLGDLQGEPVVASLSAHPVGERVLVPLDSDPLEGRLGDLRGEPIVTSLSVQPVGERVLGMVSLGSEA